MPSQTNEYTINGITYLLNENGTNEAIVEKVDPSAIQNNTLTIPAEITNGDKNYPVTTLAGNAICNEINGPDKDNLKNLEEISFEGPITLKSRAISNCYNLKTLRFEAEVKLVEAYAIGFLPRFPLNNQIHILGGRSTKRAFVDIDQNNKEIIKGNVICYNGTPPNQIEIAFQDMIKENENFCYVEDGDKIIITKIKEECGDKVIIPEQIEGKNVVNIDSTAFDEVRDKVKIVEIKSKIKTIEKELFKNCKKLTQVTLPEKIEKISDGSFSGTKNLTSLTIPYTTKTIANNAFEGCKINLISDSQDVKNYVDTLGTSNVTFQKLQVLLNSEWQYFENITPTYQLDVTTDLILIVQKLSSLETSIQDNTKKQIIENLRHKIDYERNNPPTNDIKYIAFSIPGDEKIYRIAVAAANYDGIKNLTDQLKRSNIVCEPSVKAYRQDKNQGPEQYERYLYEFNKTINGKDQAKNDLDNKSPLEHTRNPYSFESNKDEYYNPIYVDAYRKFKENPIKGRKLFGKKFKKNGSISNINDPQNQALNKNTNSKIYQFLYKLDHIPENKELWQSIKNAVKKPLIAITLGGAAFFAVTHGLPIIVNSAIIISLVVLANDFIKKLTKDPRKVQSSVKSNTPNPPQSNPAHTSSPSQPTPQPAPTPSNTPTLQDLQQKIKDSKQLLIRLKESDRQAQENPLMSDDEKQLYHEKLQAQMESVARYIVDFYEILDPDLQGVSLNQGGSHSI